MYLKCICKRNISTSTESWNCALRYMYKNVYMFLEFHSIYILIVGWITTWKWLTDIFPVPLLGISVSISNLSLFFDKTIKTVLCQVLNGYGSRLQQCRKDSLREGPMLTCSCNNNIMPHPTPLLKIWKYNSRIILHWKQIFKMCPQNFCMFNFMV